MSIIEDEQSFYLMANPSRINKNIVYLAENLNEEIYFLLHKRFKEYIFDEEIFKTIIENIEQTLKEYTIVNTVDKFIDNLIESIDIIKNE